MDMKRKIATKKKTLTETNMQTIPQTHDLYILTVTLRGKE
jgi:hypothetical protein